MQKEKKHRKVDKERKLRGRYRTQRERDTERKHRRVDTERKIQKGRYRKADTKEKQIKRYHYANTQRHIVFYNFE